jgi:hypothetical protein
LAESEATKAGDIFKQQFVHSAVHTCYNILLKNLKRFVFTDDDALAKNELSESCLQFIMCLSKQPLLRQHLRSKQMIVGGTFAEILKAEENTVSIMMQDV